MDKEKSIQYTQGERITRLTLLKDSSMVRIVSVLDDEPATTMSLTFNELVYALDFFKAEHMDDLKRQDARVAII